MSLKDLIRETDRIIRPDGYPNMTAHEKKQYDLGMELAQLIGAIVNPMGTGKAFKQGLIDGMQNNHRTLQQLAFGLIFLPMVKTFSDWEGDPMRTDLRNKAATECAKRLVEAYEKECPDEPSIEALAHHGFPCI